MILYTYFRSSAAYRVRLALHLKGIQFESRFIHLLRGGGEQLSAEYKRLNPLGRVPTLIDGDQVLTQSGAILEYLDEEYPATPLLPDSVADRAFVRSIAHTIIADTQPLQNLGVARHLSRELGLSQEAVNAWTRHWMSNGLAAVESLLAGRGAGGDYCCGDRPGIADICIVAQCFATRRFELPLNAYPNVVRIDTRCRELAAFRAAAPEAQPDFEG